MKTMNINGIEYVKKDELDKLKKNMKQNYVKREEFDNLKGQMRKSLMDLNVLIGVEEKPKLKKLTRASDDDIFRPTKSTSKKIELISINDDGTFIKKSGHRTRFTKNQIDFLKQNVNPKTTYRDIRKMSRIIKLNPQMTRNLIYNIQIGTFDKFL